ncbi:glutamine synthetase family protein [Mycolicibacterium sp.]|uniref:glutamine synthetase family protein n=1 Tax=Mycolicibacterium sp. TaxID=2320850 RepID=UPI003D0D0E78
MSGSERASAAVATLGDAAIHRIRVETPDINGCLRGKHVLAEKALGGKPLAFPEAYLALTLDDDMIDVPIGREESGFPDLFIDLDWDTLRLVPGEAGVAAVIGDGVRADRVRHPMHPRSVLRNVVDRAGAAGYEGVFGVEYEFWVFRADEAGQRARIDGDVAGMTRLSRTKQGYSLLRWSDHSEFATDLLEGMRSYGGVDIETLLTEIGNGMLEAATAPAPALVAADAAARFKILARDVARRHGLFVTFMAKLIPGEQGSSGHLHQSLLRNGKNVFWGGAPNSLSREGLSYAAGLMRVADECGAIFAPFVNSYRRYAPGQFVPLEPSWGWDDRMSAVRAITTEAKACRFEFRRPGADLNPYLAIAACLAGGVDAIQRGDDPGDPGARAAGHELPNSLPDAVRRLRNSRVAKDWLGPAIVDLYVAGREQDQHTWNNHAAQNIPDWEIRRYFEEV